MAKNKVQLFIDMEDTYANLERAGANAKKATESMLKASKKVITDKLISDTVPGNYPAQGKYSTGRLAQSIDTDYSVEWEGTTAKINIGYDFDRTGLESIVLMYGTPKMKPAQKLYDDIYGSKTKKEIKKIQQEALNKILERAMK